MLQTTSWVQTRNYSPVSSWDTCYPHSHQIRPGTVGMNLESGVHVLSWLSLDMCSSQWTEKCSPRTIRPQIQGVLVYPSQKGRRVCSHLTLHPDDLEKNINTFHCSVFTHLLSSYFCRFYRGHCWKGPTPAEGRLRGSILGPLEIAVKVLCWLHSWELCPVISGAEKKEEGKYQGRWRLPPTVPAPFTWLHFISWDCLWDRGTGHRVLCLLKEIVLWFGLKRLDFAIQRGSQSYISHLYRNKTRYKDRNSRYSWIALDRHQ